MKNTFEKMGKPHATTPQAMDQQHLQILLTAQQQSLGCLKRCLVHSNIPQYISDSLTEQYGEQMKAISETEAALQTSN